MEDFYHTGGMHDLTETPDADLIQGLKESAKRKLRALRVLLILWGLSFVGVVFWFTIVRW